MSRNRKFQLFFTIFLILTIIGILGSTSIPERGRKPIEATNQIRSLNEEGFTFNEFSFINVTFFSESTNNSNQLEIVGDPSNSASELAMKLPSPPQHDQWFGHNTSIKIYNLLDNRTWGQNCDFAFGTDNGTSEVNVTDTISYYYGNDTINGWEDYHYEVVNEPPGDYYNDMTVEYDTAEKCVNLTLYGYGTGMHRYDGGEYVGIRQTGIDVYRGAITNAWIKVIYDPVHFLNVSIPSFSISTEINGVEVYSKNNYELLGIDFVNTGWIPLYAWINTSKVFPEPAENGFSNFNLSISLRDIYHSAHGVGAVDYWLADYQRIQIYGFYLALETSAQPNSTDIQLMVNNRQINGSFGEAQLQWTNNYPDFICTDPYELIFNSSSQDNYIDLTFEVDVNFQVVKFVGTTKSRDKTDLGGLFEVEYQKDIIKYEFYLYSYWDFSKFSNFYFNFSIPADWNITLVQNPSLAFVYNRTAGLN